MMEGATVEKVSAQDYRGGNQNVLEIAPVTIEVFRMHGCHLELLSRALFSTAAAFSSPWPPSL